MKLWITWVSLCLSASMASASVDAFLGLVGNYRILSWQGETAVGKLELVATDTQLGWSVALENGTSAQAMISREAAVAYEKPGKIYLTDAADLRRTLVIFEKVGDSWVIDSTQCVEGACLAYFGEAVRDIIYEFIDSRSFFHSLEGSYSIQKAGGEVPTKPETFDVDASSDEAEAAIYAPYCEPGSNVCDLGYIAFPWEKVSVVRSVQNSDVVYDISVGEGETLRKYQWIEKPSGAFVFRNLQYVLPSSQAKVVLDHEISKTF